MSEKSIYPIELSQFPVSSNILQSAYWGRIKSSFGWKPYYYNYKGTGLLVLTRKIFAKYYIAYVPHGPQLSVTDQNAPTLKEMGNEVKKSLPSGCILLRFDLPTGKYQLDPVLFNFEPPLKKSFSDIQPPDTVILSLKETEEDILSRMKSKTRYNIRLAFRKGIVVKMSGVEGLDEWYQLYKETALRDKITIHSKEYYRMIFDISLENPVTNKNPEIILFKAEYNEQILAGIIVVVYGTRATYLYGASSNDHRNLMPAYALQWEAIKYAKSKGCSEYDLFGIPPENNPDHPMSGLYRFKTGFGGDILHRPGCWDLPLKPVIYQIYRWAEYFRLLYYKKLRKK
jgi:lipid II:glycine glycyltransferase (peptidoglycan interpeptide bridge formation enzyme)